MDNYYLIINLRETIHPFIRLDSDRARLEISGIEAKTRFNHFILVVSGNST